MSHMRIVLEAPSGTQVISSTEITSDIVQKSAEGVSLWLDITTKLHSATKGSEELPHEVSEAHQRVLFLYYVTRSYTYYPLLSTLMHVLVVSSATFLAADRIAKTMVINPYVLLCMLVGSLGMSAVLASASREIDQADND